MKCLGLALAMVSVVVPLACIERDRLCATTWECGATAACVAGRCQPVIKDDAGRILPPAISSPLVRRVIAMPADIAYVSARAASAGDGPANLPPVLLLGRSGDSAALLLRFSVPMAEDETVIEAYVLLDRADVVESDPQPISLHAARIIDAWDERSISFERQPRWEETGSPAAIVTGAGRPLVRIDVRSLVKHWRERDPRDQGIAVVADATSRTGMAFAATAPVADEGSASMLGSSDNESSGNARWAPAPPRLELYLRAGTHETRVNLPPAATSNASATPSARREKRK